MLLGLLITIGYSGNRCWSASVEPDPVPALPDNGFPWGSILRKNADADVRGAPGSVDAGVPVIHPAGSADHRRCRNKNDFVFNNYDYNESPFSSVTRENDYWNKTKIQIPSPQKPRRIGKRVYHDSFGYGTVIRENGNRLEVHFDNYGLKKVLSHFLSEN